MRTKTFNFAILFAAVSIGFASLSSIEIRRNEVDVFDFAEPNPIVDAAFRSMDTEQVERDYAYSGEK